MAFVLVGGLAAVGGWLYGGRAAAAVGVVAALVAGIVLARPLAMLAKRLFLRTAPWRAEPGPLEFADTDLGFTVEAFAGELDPRELVDHVSNAGGRFSSGEISLELWMVASDELGQAWTIVQEVHPTRAGRVAWTSSVDGGLTIADFDNTGRPNPFRAVHRLVKEEFDVPLVDTEVFAWGREHHATGTRATMVTFARTSIGVEQLTGFEYPEDPQERTAHLIPVTLDGVAKALGWGHPENWRGGSALGLLELLEIFQPGAWATLERRIAPRWHEKGMFARVERGTERVTGRTLVAPF